MTYNEVELLALATVAENFAAKLKLSGRKLDLEIAVKSDKYGMI